MAPHRGGIENVAVMGIVFGVLAALCPFKWFALLLWACCLACSLYLVTAGAIAVLDSLFDWIVRRGFW